MQKKIFILGMGVMVWLASSMGIMAARADLLADESVSKGTRSVIWIESFDNSAGKSGDEFYNAFSNALVSMSHHVTFIWPTEEKQDNAFSDSVYRRVKLSAREDGKKIKVGLSMMDKNQKKAREKEFSFDFRDEKDDLKDIVAFLTRDTGVKIKDIQITPPPSLKNHLNVALWLDRPHGEYRTGEEMTLYYQVSQDSYLSIYVLKPRGEVLRLFPNKGQGFNLVEGGRVYPLKLSLKCPVGVYALKGVATLDPSNAEQPGVQFKSEGMEGIHVGPMRIIPSTKTAPLSGKQTNASMPVTFSDFLFSDWELTRFFKLPLDCFDEKQINYHVVQ